MHCEYASGLACDPVAAALVFGVVPALATLGPGEPLEHPAPTAMAAAVRAAIRNRWICATRSSFVLRLSFVARDKAAAVSRRFPQSLHRAA
jgi:hypothetical protein